MAKRTGIVREFFLFIRQNKAYWLVPLLIALGLLAVLMVMAETGLAPWIYALW